MTASQRLKCHAAGIRRAAAEGLDYDPEAQMEYDQDQEETRDLSRGIDGGPGRAWQDTMRPDSR